MELIAREKIDSVFDDHDSNIAIGIYEDILDLPTVEAYTKDEVIKILEDIRSEIKGHMEKVKVENSEFWQFVSLGAELYNAAIQERINELKGDKNEAS